MTLLKKLFLGGALAFSMLTTLPFFKVHDFFRGINGYAVMFYPLVGFVLGALLSGFFYLLNPYLPESYLYVLTFALWILLTGALHLDGVADVFDALFVPKARREEVLKDPHIGAMGAIFTLLFMLVKFFALMQVESLYLLPLVLMFSRFNAVLAIYFFDYIRKEGMGALAKSELTLWQLLTSSALLMLLAWLVNGQISLWMLLLILLPLFFIYGVAQKSFGGFSGDLYGLLIEVTELCLLQLIMFKILL